MEIKAHRGYITGPKSHSYLLEEQGFKTRPFWLQKLMLSTSKYNPSHFNPCIFHGDGAESFGVLVFWLISLNRAISDVSSALCLVSSFFLPIFLAQCTYSITFFLSIGRKAKASYGLSLWYCRSLVSLPGGKSAFVQDCNVYLKGMFNHRSDFFMSLIYILVIGKMLQSVMPPWNFPITCIYF